jgi:hypothetical protein
MLGRFNGFLKAVILRVSEVRDLGEVDRYTFYEASKTFMAAPPDVLRCDEKNLREHPVPNVCGVVITSNYKTGGLYLPANDRRHFVAWSPRTRDDFSDRYWRELWSWYVGGGKAHVAALLSVLDLTDFDPKAPPYRTPAFWDVAESHRVPEDAELADIVDGLGTPEALTLDDLRRRATGDFLLWLGERRNYRQIPHRLETVGYAPVRNEGAKDGLWKIEGKRQAIYARAELSRDEQHAVALALVNARSVSR